MSDDGRDAVVCRCTKATLEIFCRRDAEGEIVSCWVTLDEAGVASPGCVPDERTGPLIERRNSNLRREVPKRPLAVPGNTVVLCTCGRRTRVCTSNFATLVDPPAVDSPPDASVPFAATACWLSIADDGGPEDGCAPDQRTEDILARRRGRKPNRPVPELAAAAPIIIPEADRAAFAALQLQAATAAAAPRRKSVPAPVAQAMPEAPLLPEGEAVTKPPQEQIAPEPAALSLFSLPEPPRQFHH